MEKLYHTEIINNNGTDGDVEIVGGMAYKVSSPLKEGQEGLNPEQLMGMAWSTCLNATLVSLLKGRDQAHLKSRVRVIVDMMKEENMPGYYFKMKAIVAIETFDNDKTMKLALQADKYCPVSKLIQGNPHVSIEVESY